MDRFRKYNFTDVVKDLDNVNISDISGVNPTYEENSGAASYWNEKIGIAKLEQYMLNYLNKEEINININYTINHKRHHELLQRSLCVKDQLLVKVYVPIKFVKTNTKIVDALHKKENIMPFFQYDITTNLTFNYQRYIIHDLEFYTDLRYKDLIIPLLYISKECTLQNNKLKCIKGKKSISSTRGSVLVLGFPYQEYMNLFRIIFNVRDMSTMLDRASYYMDK